ncbi:MAG TPA: potassium transporter TrkG, partial [Bacteroidia bacterium]|nr:potassium transporter TrkG [Bacteroidia bacterium]
LTVNKLFFIVFIVNYLVKLGIAPNSKAFLRQNWLEAFLLLLVIYDAISFYIFKVPVVNRIFSYLNIDPLSSKYAFFIQFFLILLVVIEFVKSARNFGKIPLKPGILFILSFLILIFGGAGLLSLPAINTTGQSMRFIDAVFTSASASCVTGLIVEDTATFFNFKGQVIILGLIQLGGLGIITFATYFATFYKKGVGIKHQYALQQLLDTDSLVGSYGLIRKIFIYTFGIELISAACIFFLWGNYDFESNGERLYFSIFHAVTAFCNAGFSTFTGGMMEPGIHNKYILHMIIAITVFFGSLGFPAMRDMFEIKNLRERLNKPWKKWKLSTQIAFYTSIVLVIIGAIAFYFLENDNTLKGLDTLPAVITSVFQSVITRTAGFNTVDFTILTTPILVLFIFLMFVGASSGSTGGGIKTSTFVVVFSAMWAMLRGRKLATMGRRTISHELIYKAFAVFIFSATFIFICTFLLTLTDPQFPVLKILFEEVSAFSTTGLSTGITAGFSDAGKIILIVTMFVGRVGILTLAFALSSEVASNAYKYPNSHIMIG